MAFAFGGIDEFLEAYGRTGILIQHKLAIQDSSVSIFPGNLGTHKVAIGKPRLNRRLNQPLQIQFFPFSTEAEQLAQPAWGWFLSAISSATAAAGSYWQLTSILLTYFEVIKKQSSANISRK